MFEVRLNSPWLNVANRRRPPKFALTPPRERIERDAVVADCCLGQIAAVHDERLHHPFERRLGASHFFPAKRGRHVAFFPAPDGPSGSLGATAADLSSTGFLRHSRPPPM